QPAGPVGTRPQTPPAGQPTPGRVTPMTRRDQPAHAPAAAGGDQDPPAVQTSGGGSTGPLLMRGPAAPDLGGTGVVPWRRAGSPWSRHRGGGVGVELGGVQDRPGRPPVRERAGP